ELQYIPATLETRQAVHHHHQYAEHDARKHYGDGETEDDLFCRHQQPVVPADKPPQQVGASNTGSHDDQRAEKQLRRYFLTVINCIEQCGEGYYSPSNQLAPPIPGYFSQYVHSFTKNSTCTFSGTLIRINGLSE